LQIQVPVLKERLYPPVLAEVALRIELLLTMAETKKVALVDIQRDNLLEKLIKSLITMSY
jgi:hypothetical protein